MKTKNNAPYMAIVSTSIRTLGNKILDLDEDPNEREVQEKASKKRKRLDKLND